MEGSYKASPTKITLTCEVCLNEYQTQKANTTASKHHFCSRKCYGQGITSGIVERSIPMLPVTRQKLRVAAVERHKRQPHPRRGAILTQETKDKISLAHMGQLLGPLNGMFGKHHTEEVKLAMSEKHSLAFVEGRRKPYGKNGRKFGRYVSNKAGKQMPYRSSWELSTMEWLDQNTNVLTYDYECLRIPYFTQDEIQKYKRYYKLLLDLRNHLTAGITLHSEETLKRSRALTHKNVWG